MRRLAIMLLWLLWRLLPARALAKMGGMLGSWAYYLGGSRLRVAETNLRLCFPQWDEARRRHVLKEHFCALMRSTLLETVSWWGSRSELEKIARLEGREHYLAHAGKPVIWLAPHFLGLNLGGVRLTTEFAPAVTIYAPIKNPLIDRLMLHARSRFEGASGKSEIYSRHNGIKPVLRAIKKGLPFYYLPDLDYGRKDAVFVPFFGVPAATITGLSRIAKATGAVVVPCITHWNGKEYVTRFYPAWQDFPTQDVVADTRRMNAFIEDRIREMPEQYFWVHKRFKTQPDGGKGDLYAD